MSVEYADGIPNERGIFKGLAQAPLYFHNAVAELVDNALAAKEKDFNIQIDISPHPSRKEVYVVTIVDDATGIPLERLKDHAFKTGNPPPSGSSHLREHGFGLKNVLAKIETLGTDPWTFYTREHSAVGKRVFYKVERPLQYKMPINIRPSSEWPSFGAKSTGTMVSFAVPLSYMQTVTRGRRGRPPAGLAGIMQFLREHLGVFYRGYLEGGKKSPGSITTSINWKNIEEVEPVLPDYKTRSLVRQFRIHTKAGDLDIEGEYGLLEATSKPTRVDRVYYYRNTLESQGVDLRIGRRVVATRLVTEIWQKARHPSLNGVWGEFRIPGASGCVPRTLNNKTSIDFDDELWIEIAEAIRKQVPDLPKQRVAKEEADLREELANQLRGHMLPGDVIEENYPCFCGSGVVVDIYRDETLRKGELIIYETKAGKAHPIDVYQLRMYWDGFVEDGRQPTRAYLVSHNKTTGVPTVIKVINSYKDRNGNPYIFEFKTWKDFNI